MELLCPPLNLPHQVATCKNQSKKSSKSLQAGLAPPQRKITKSSSSVSVEEGLHHVNQEKEAKSVALLGLDRMNKQKIIELEEGWNTMQTGMLKKILEGLEEPQFKLDEYIMLYTYPSSLHFTTAGRINAIKDEIKDISEKR
ncbi:hypothetical protein Tco_1077677 [Tanacetum coccineum]